MSSDVIERKLTNLMRLSDLNGDGVLELSDWEIWVGRLAAIRGWQPGSEQYTGLETLFLGAFAGLQAACGRDDGRIEIGEMREALVAMSQAGSEDIARWGDAMFEVIDANGDGVIGPEEYRHLLAIVSIDGDVADASFARLDLNGDGHLSHDEWAQHYLEFFKSDDPDAPGSWLWGPF